MPSRGPVSPARLVDYIGIVAGFVAPALLTAYVVGGAAWTNVDPAQRNPGGVRYSHIRDTMSALGDRDNAIGVLFAVVNLVIAALLVIFTMTAHRRLPVGKAVIAGLIIAVAATFAIGLARCQDGCPVPPATGQADAFMTVLHIGLAVVTIVVIVAIPFAAFLRLPSVPRGGPLRALAMRSGVIAIFAASATLALVLAILVASSGRANVIGLTERLVWAAGYAWIVCASLAMWGCAGAIPCSRST